MCVCGTLQYSMLSGKAPFSSSSRNDRAVAIMHRIRGGEFNLEGQPWDSVSDQAKKLIQGRWHLRQGTRV